VFHISIWGGLGALFGGLSPPKTPVATGLYWQWKHWAYVKLYSKNLVLKKTTIWCWRDWPQWQDCLICSARC